MKESTSREKVLKNIRNALISKTDNPYPDIDLETSVYTDITEPLDITFAQEFTKNAGKFIFCENEKEFLYNLLVLVSDNNWSNIFCFEKKIQHIFTKEEIPFCSNEKDFFKVEVGITSCEYLIARTGSIMVSSKQTNGRRTVVYPPIHVVLAYTSQLVADLKQALTEINEKYSTNLPSMISVISGPSRTADIEKTLIMGAHGPKEVYVFLIDDAC